MTKRGPSAAPHQCFLGYQQMIPREAFFNRENIERVMAAAACAAT